VRANQPSVKWLLKALSSRVKRQCMTFTIHFNIVRRLRMRGTVTPLFRRSLLHGYLFLL
jgi:hypothetical protein